jgi:hypothetical protein
MADTTETKTYIIKIQSDLNKYTKEAIAAKKALEDAKLAVDNLTSGQFKSREEIEKVNAAYRAAKKEYADKTKLVDLSTKALKAEQGSYEQLLRIHKLMETALKLEAGTIKRSADGNIVLTEKYIQLSKEVQNAKKGLDEFGKGINDNRLNVGNYGQAIEGAFKDAGSKIMSMVGPLGLIGAAIAVGTKLWQGFKDAITSTTFAIDIMNKSAAVSKQLFFDLAINGKVTLENLVKASQLQGELNVLRIKDAAEVLQVAKINREEQEIREIAIDQTKTEAERLAALIKVKDLESQKTKIRVGNLKDELAVLEELWKQQPTEKIMMRILELRAKIEDTYAAEEVAMRRVTSQLTGFEQDKIDARKKGYDAWMAEIDATNKANEDAAAKRKENEDKSEKERLKNLHDENEKIKKYAIAEMERLDKEAETKWNKEVEFQRTLFDARRKAGQEEHDARVAEAEALAQAELEIQQTLTDSKMNLASATANFLGSIAGKNNSLQNAALIADKALAIAEVVIQTTKANATIRATAAASVLPGPAYLARLAANMAAAMVPINLNRAAAALDIAAIIAATASQIRSNNSSSGGGSSPNAISSSPAAQRTFAQAQGSSILTQVQLSQPQLNAIPNENMLTAADIANAIKGIPAPIVTVEDFNVKVKAMTKVAVRANI